MFLSLLIESLPFFNLTPNDRAPFEIPRFLPRLRFPPSCRQINLTGQRSVSFGIVGRVTAGLPPQPDAKPGRC